MYDDVTVNTIVCSKIPLGRQAKARAMKSQWLLALLPIFIHFPTLLHSKRYDRTKMRSASNANSIHSHDKVLDLEF